MNSSKRLWVGLVILAAAARLLPHPWNFTPMVAMALFAGNQARRMSTGILVTLSALMASDAILGFYGGFWFVYAATLIPVLLGRLTRDRSGFASIASAGLASSLAFFVTTNFMVWARGNMYPHTLAGLTASFVAGLPFYGNQIMGDLFYTVAIFGAYQLAAKTIGAKPLTA